MAAIVPVMSMICTDARRETMVRVEGFPDMAHVSTPHVECRNRAMRMHMRRFTRLTNAFSMTVENRARAVTLNCISP